jgi:hypothetical protein
MHVFFTFMWLCIMTNFLIIKPTRCTIFSNLFWNETLLYSTAVPSQSCSCCLQTCMTYTTAECTVNNSWWWTEELSKTCRVSFQNKFEKIVHLVGFIIRKSNTCDSRSDTHFNRFAHNRVVRLWAAGLWAQCTASNKHQHVKGISYIHIPLTHWHPPPELSKRASKSEILTEETKNIYKFWHFFQMGRFNIISPLNLHPINVSLHEITQQKLQKHFSIKLHVSDITFQWMTSQCVIHDWRRNFQCDTTFYSYIMSTHFGLFTFSHLHDWPIRKHRGTELQLITLVVKHMLLPRNALINY